MKHADSRADLQDTRGEREMTHDELLAFKKYQNEQRDISTFKTDMKRLGITNAPWDFKQRCECWVESIAVDTHGEVVCHVNDYCSDAQTTAVGNLLKTSPLLYHSLRQMVGTCYRCKLRTCYDCMNPNAHCMLAALQALDAAEGKVFKRKGK